MALFTSSEFPSFRQEAGAVGDNWWHHGNVYGVCNHASILLNFNRAYMWASRLLATLFDTDMFIAVLQVTQERELSSILSRLVS